jgi:hypothetical protein
MLSSRITGASWSFGEVRSFGEIIEVEVGHYVGDELGVLNAPGGWHRAALAFVIKGCEELYGQALFGSLLACQYFAKKVFVDLGRQLCPYTCTVHGQFRRSWEGSTGAFCCSYLLANYF